VTYAAYPYHYGVNLAAQVVVEGAAPSWIAIVVAVIAACAAFFAAAVAAWSARSVKRVEIEAQRISELENRISERKYETYKPMIETLRDALFGNEGMGTAKPNAETIAKTTLDFSTWITVFGSDNAVRAFHNFIQAAYNSVPPFVATRLYAEFILAARRDIGYPDTHVTPLQVIGLRVNDLYTEEEYRLALTLPFEELCRGQNWTPPWLRADG
jgi:hypothetical protein